MNRATLKILILIVVIGVLQTFFGATTVNSGRLEPSISDQIVEYGQLLNGEFKVYKYFASD
jgi:heme A synthase